ncbi:hypothetical protein F511_36609 [Dorcoceras hygrometricum]|uniref:Uncharacterized protein n=1 Tax=Dorcoceras hygrometricum TaxID=472368 RepID=A0A2Z7BND0_9LAMI|nr:hypothetical protein F511_36609 [Dorcoceras hygrometricum]
MSSWKKANSSLFKLYESQKQVSDKTGIGFNNSEFCEGESSTQSRPAYDKFNKMSFVKADMMYNCLESVKYDNQNSPKLNENGKAGIGFSKPERLKPDWLKNRLDKDKAKASQKPFIDSDPVIYRTTLLRTFQVVTICRVDKSEVLVVLICDARTQWGHENWDIELLVSLRAQVIDEVATFFHSFSLKKLAMINFEEMYRKEEQVLSWGETESPQEAIQRKFYILLKYRTVLVWKFLDAWRANFAPGQGSSAVDIQVIELLSDLYISFLEELAKEARAHSLIWNKPSCSKIFEGSPRDRGAVIARTNSNTRSSCWIRTMILVDGMWTVEPCADRWVKIPRKVISTEVPHQRQFYDTLPSMSVFFRLMKKRWADVCLEVTGFCAYRRLLPVGSINFCRALEVVETDSCFASRQPIVFSLRLSQFCTIQIQYSLFSSLSTADISDFLSSIALDRTAFRSVQIAQSVVPSVQPSLDQRPSSPISPDISSSLRFDQTDIDATASSRPPISQDLSAAFADFQAALSEQIFVSQSDISSRMHKIEQSVCDSLRDQADIFRLADVRQVVEAVNAKVDIMASRINAIQKDAEATKEALSHQLLEFQSSDVRSARS